MIERTTMPDAFIWEKRERKSDIIMDYGGGALLPRQTDSKLSRNADEFFKNLCYTSIRKNLIEYAQY